MRHRRMWWIAVVTLAAALGTPALPARAAPAARPQTARPATPAGLPSGIEQLSPYLRQVSCDPVAKPGAVALGRLLVATYPGTSYGIVRECGANDIPSEHYEGRAVDWMTSVRDPDGAARADAVLHWLLDTDADGHRFANARRLGVMYLIWDDHIWGSYATDAGWRPYSTCADHPDSGWDTRCHRDHLHISLSWAGAMGRTSFWRRSVAGLDYGPCRPADLNWAAPYRRPNRAPCPAHSTVTAPDGAPAIASAVAHYSGATVARGSIGPVVTTVQAALGVQTTGYFGSLTAAAVSAFRQAHGLPAGTRMDGATWRALLATTSAAGPAEG